MDISFGEMKKEDLGIRARAILGVPEEILTDDIISSPVFLKRAESYIILTEKGNEYEYTYKWNMRFYGQRG